MKRLMLTLLLLAGLCGTAAAQNCMVVDSEKLFKSIDEYNNALKTLDAEAEAYQAQVDQKFAEVESLYNNYMLQKSSLSAAARQSRESAILAREKEATEFQTGIFGADGTLMKRRIELIQPIQKRVFAAIEAYAKANGFDLVIDSASNATMLYHSAGIDRTQQVIEYLKK